MLGGFIFSVVLGLFIGFCLYMIVRLVKSDLKDSEDVSSSQGGDSFEKDS